VTRHRGGSLFLLLTPDDLLAKLATLVPLPRVHALRYHGVFAPNSRARRRVVPPGAPNPPTANCRPTEAQPKTEPVPTRTYRVPWADLLKKVFTIDVLACPQCSGRMKLIAFIANEAVARHILDHLGLDSTGPPLARPLAADELLESAPDHDVADPVYPD
jgi:hypothetical protein